MSTDEIEDEIRSIDRHIEDLEDERDKLQKQLKEIESGKFNDVVADVRERCAVLEGLRLTGAEIESLEYLRTSDAPDTHDLRRLKQIELNHLPETIFA